jgi:hypothetical protein
MSLDNSVKIICIRHKTTIKQLSIEAGMSENGFRKSVKDGKLTYNVIEQLAINHNLTVSEFIYLGEDK